MCGRYSLFVDPGRIESRFDVTVDGYEPRYNAAPGQSLPVVTDDEAGTLTHAEWGLIPPWAERREDGGHINARAETLSERASFRAAFEQSGEAGGRCLVPADGFYEWTEVEGRNQPFRVTVVGGDLFAMAGLWADWEPPTTQTGIDDFTDQGAAETAAETVRTFTIVTTEPNDVVRDLHHRMAVVLPRGDEWAWLEAAAPDVRDSLRPAPADGMDYYPVSTAVNDPSNDRPGVVEAVDLGGAGPAG
jgi:putative SOS response-associated peptidase YedK